MTDYLPPPPAEIVIDPINPLEQAFNAQGGNQHKFVVQNPTTSDYFETNVSNFNYHYSNSVKLSRQVASFEEIIKDRVRDGDLDVDNARELADCFGIELAREVQFCVQVEYTFTAEVPLDEDVDSAIENFNFNVEAGWGSEVDIDHVDTQIIHNEWQEV
jgi:hypothetical protein